MPRSLEPMRELLTALGNPQAQFESVVVTGSVGKGTASYQLSVDSYQSLAVSRQPSAVSCQLPKCVEGEGWDGKRGIGLYTGPHMHSFRERFRVDGEMISPEAFVAGMEAVLAAENRTKQHYSTFELATALALWWFAERGVKRAVLEVGIGGRWDAVNVVPHRLAVITPIELEHVAMLGGSLQTIAYHKAGIIPQDGVVISAVQDPLVTEVLHHEARLKNAKLIFTDHIPLAAQLMFGIGDPQSEVVSLPGRLEQVTVKGKSILIDGGHTVLSGRRLREYIDQAANDEPVCMVIGMLRDKAVRDYLRVFDAPHFRIMLTQAPGHRALSADALAEQAGLQNAQVEIVPELETALNDLVNAPEAIKVAAGSLRMAAFARETYGLLTAEELSEAQATRAIFEGDAYLHRLNLK